MLNDATCFKAVYIVTGYTNTCNKWTKSPKTVTYMFLYIENLSREGGRTVGSGREATIIE